MVEKAYAALKEFGNTLCVAPTGAGKTIILSALSARIGGKQLIVQHRDELVTQNFRSYFVLNPNRTRGVYSAARKDFSRDTTFAMAPTLCRNLGAIPRLDAILFDECHHVAAATWQKILARAREMNPDILVGGFTATANRSDRKSLISAFTNVADQVTIQELVSQGYLVPPRAFVEDVNGTLDALDKLPSNDFGEQQDVASILDTDVVSSEVIRNWRERAEGRKTIVFASTVEHAYSIARAFASAGIPAESLDGNTKKRMRNGILGRFKSGETQVLTNVMVLTEGFDQPDTSCVILLRKCSAKGPMVQMVGRGLRLADGKEDCVVMDFGSSLLTHGNLDIDVELEPEDQSSTEEKYKDCPKSPDGFYRVPNSSGQKGCGARVPSSCLICPICGYKFERVGTTLEHDPVTGKLSVIKLTEMDILTSSPFKYVDLFANESAILATGFKAWVGIFCRKDGVWVSLGMGDDGSVLRLGQGNKLVCLALADEFMKGHETNTSSKKARRWQKEPITDRQVEMLERHGYSISKRLWDTDVPYVIFGEMKIPLDRYTASCHISFVLNAKEIEREVTKDA